MPGYHFKEASEVAMKMSEPLHRHRVCVCVCVDSENLTWLGMISARLSLPRLSLSSTVSSALFSLSGKLNEVKQAQIKL